MNVINNPNKSYEFGMKVLMLFFEYKLSGEKKEDLIQSLEILIESIKKSEKKDREVCEVEGCEKDQYESGAGYCEEHNDQYFQQLEWD